MESDVSGPREEDNQNTDEGDPELREILNRNPDVSEFYCEKCKDNHQTKCKDCSCQVS